MPEPLPTAFFNGTFVPLEDVRISPLDRGFLFADGVYEVIPAYHGKLFRLRDHLTRLERSLREIRLDPPAIDWPGVLAELVTRNGAGNQAVYLQITRGVMSARDHIFPEGDTAPTVFAMSSPLADRPTAELKQGIAAITLEDTRWQRCDIKSIALLPNVLARQQAREAGADEAILLRDSFVTEGAATSVFLVRDGAVQTPPPGNELLPGITRQVVGELAQSLQIPVQEERIPVDALFTADEVWLASTTREISAVTRLNGHPIGDGRPGPVWHAIHESFQQLKARS